MSDCMTQEDAEKMDNRQAVEILKPLRDMMRDQHGCPISDAFFALNKAIEALSAQPTYTDEQIQKMQDLEQVQIQTAYEIGKAERKTGRWIVIKSPDKYHCDMMKCSECGFDDVVETDEYKFCPHCGAKMEVDA